MSTMKSVKRSIAILKRPAPNLALVNYVQDVVKAMTGNPAFTSPVPALAIVPVPLARG